MRLKVVIGIKPEKEGYFVGEKIILVAKLMTTSLFSRETHSFDIGSKKDSLQFNWQIGNESFENKGNIINYKIEENGEKARLITVEVKDKTSSKIKPIIGRVIIKIKNVKFGIDIYNYNEKKTLSKEFGSILPIEVGKNSTLILTPLIEGDDINNYLIGWEYKNQLNKTHGIESNQNALVLKAESRERIKCNFNKKDNTIKQYLDRIIEIKEKYKENIEIRIIKPKTKDELEIEEDVEFPVMAKIAGDINNKVKEVFWGIFKRTELEPLPIKGYLTITKPNEEINFKIQKFPSGEYSLLAAGIDKDGNIIGKSDKINIYIIEKNEKIEEEIKVDNEQTQKTLIEDKIKVKIISPSTKEDTQIPFPIEINKKIIVMAIINEDTKNKVKEIFWTVMPKDVQINELTIKEYNYLISSYPSQGENLDLKGINSGEYILIATAVDEKREPMKYFDTINIKIGKGGKGGFDNYPTSVHQDGYNGDSSYAHINNKLIMTSYGGNGGRYNNIINPCSSGDFYAGDGGLGKLYLYKGLIEKGGKGDATSWRYSTTLGNNKCQSGMNGGIPYKNISQGGRGGGANANGYSCNYCGSDGQNGYVLISY